MRITVILPVLACLISSGCGKVASRTVATVTRSGERRVAAVLARDLERDAASRTMEIQAPRRVFKYTTQADAERILEKGVSPGIHFTSKAVPGRPLTATHAAKRYGLNIVPEKRITLTLPSGTSVKSNKVIGGAAGYGELRVEQPLPPGAVERVVNLPRQP